MSMVYHYCYCPKHGVLSKAASHLASHNVSPKAPQDCTWPQILGVCCLLPQDFPQSQTPLAHTKSLSRQSRTQELLDLNHCSLRDTLSESKTIISLSRYHHHYQETPAATPPAAPHSDLNLSLTLQHFILDCLLPSL